MKNIWKLFLVIIIVVVVGYLLKDTFTIKKQMVVYCMNSAETKLVPETRDIKVKDNNDLINKIVLELKKNPIDKNLKKPIPENVEVERIALKPEEKVLEIDFSKDFVDLSNSEKLLLRSGVANTFLQFDFINGVKMFVSGVEMKNENGENIGVIKKNDVVTDPVKQAETKKEEVITLYFVSDSTQKFIPTKRKVTITSGEKSEKAVIEELIKGPANGSGLVSPMPSGTVLKDIEVKDGICYVDFNRAFVDNAIGGLETRAGALTIYSIVNSLTELKGIERVQFLIDGQKQAGTDFDKPFERNAEE